MSVKNLIEKYEAESIDIREKIAALSERASLVDTMAKELRRHVGSVKTPAPRAAAAAKNARKPRTKGKMTAAAAILQAVGSADGPMVVREIIAAASDLSGGAETSIRTQINFLAKRGELKQVPHSGRGFRYGVAATEPAAEDET